MRRCPVRYEDGSVDLDGAILSKFEILDGYRNPTTLARPKVKDMELAPSSDPNDDPNKLNLYVTDYGLDQERDGRLFEINLDPLWA
jgi:hypothetical protein